MTNHAFDVVYFDYGQLMAKNEFVFELVFDDDRAGYVIYCQSIEEAERFRYQFEQLIDKFANGQQGANGLVEAFVTENPSHLSYRYTRK